MCAYNYFAFCIPHSHNYALDFLKGIGCIGVVFIHIGFPGLFGSFIQRSAQFAVPVFFMISGFYAYKADSATILRRAHRIFRIMLCAVAVYALFLLQNILRHGELSWTFTAQGITRLLAGLVILSNFDFIGAGHLWFLMSLFEAYIILLAVRKFNLQKVAYMYISFSVIASAIIFAVYPECPEKWHLCGNVFMSGFCWVMVGHYVAENLLLISRISRKTLYASAIIGYLIGLFSLTGRFLFISSICFNFFPASLFILAVREDSQTVKFPPSIVKIGAEYSLYVYLFHILVLNLYSSVLQRLGIASYRFVYWTIPIAVFLLSLVVSFVIVKVRDRISRKKLR